jgi:hydrogenase nickel incorporation protein HypB
MRTQTIDENVGTDGSPKLIRDALRGAGVFTISVIGGPGCGKTTLIDATIDRLMSDVNVGVVACDPVSHRDADRLARHGRHVVQVNTGEGHGLDAGHVYRALGSLDLDWTDLLFIENIGSLTGPAANDLGQDVTLAVFSVAAGDDKADKHPALVRSADVVLLNKMDLLERVPFDVAAFRDDVRRINERAEVIEISGMRAQGIDRWVEWLRKRVKRANHEEISHWFG